MNRRLVALNLALLALIGSLGWLLRTKWKEAGTHAASTIAKAPNPPVVVPPPPVSEPPHVVPGDYIDVAQKDLFTKDRNPIPVVDPPKPPPPKPPLPPLPLYYGQMALNDPVVLLSLGASPAQKSYAVGDKIGDFKLVAFDKDTITFDWNGEAVERKLTDLAPKQAAAPEAAAAAPAAVQVPAAAAVTSLSSGKNAAAESNKPAEVGADMGGGFRACVAGDNSPTGTVLNGYKKVISRTMMGQSCYWEQSK